MKLKHNIKSIRDIRKNSRVILEKLRDLSFPSKFEAVIEKKHISLKLGKSADVILCVNYIIESYECFLSVQFDRPEHPAKKYRSLVKSINILCEKIEESIKYRHPIKRKFIANVLRAHTKYFNSIELKSFNNNCTSLHEKTILSSISVWNNQWK
jgi:hypothetical protein